MTQWVKQDDSVANSDNVSFDLQVLLDVREPTAGQWCAHL